MTYTTLELITRAYYLSGVVAKRFQTPTSEQINDGLQMLNALLDIKSANQRMIPYYQEFDFTAVIGQEMYFIPNLILMESFTFNINTVRYSTYPKSRRDYFGSPRVDNIQSLPYSWHVERTRGGSNLFIYFLPNTTYPLKIWGKFSLADVTLNQDLSLTLDLFYIEYLRYALAEYICQENNVTFTVQSEKRLMELEQVIFDISPIDLTISKMSSLQGDHSINYGDVNIGRGWRPV